MGNTNELMGNANVLDATKANRSIKSAERIFLDALKEGVFKNISGSFTAKEVTKYIDKEQRASMTEFPKCDVRGVDCRGTYYVFPCKGGKTLTLSNRIGELVLKVLSNKIKITDIEKKEKNRVKKAA